MEISNGNYNETAEVSVLYEDGRMDNFTIDPLGKYELVLASPTPIIERIEASLTSCSSLNCDCDPFIPQLGQEPGYRYFIGFPTLIFYDENDDTGKDFELAACVVYECYDSSC